MIENVFTNKGLRTLFLVLSRFFLNNIKLRREKTFQNICFCVALLFVIPFSFQNVNAQNCSVNAGVDRTVCPNSSNSLPVVSSIALDGNQSAVNIVANTLEWTIVSQPVSVQLL